MSSLSDKVRMLQEAGVLQVKDGQYGTIVENSNGMVTIDKAVLRDLLRFIAQQDEEEEEE